MALSINDASYDQTRLSFSISTTPRFVTASHSPLQPHTTSALLRSILYTERSVPPVVSPRKTPSRRGRAHLAALTISVTLTRTRITFEATATTPTRGDEWSRPTASLLFGLPFEPCEENRRGSGKRSAPTRGVNKPVSRYPKHPQGQILNRDGAPSPHEATPPARHPLLSPTQYAREMVTTPSIPRTAGASSSSQDHPRSTSSVPSQQSPLLTHAYALLTVPTPPQTARLPTRVSPSARYQIRPRPQPRPVPSPGSRGRLSVPPVPSPSAPERPGKKPPPPPLIPPTV